MISKNISKKAAAAKVIAALMLALAVCVSGCGNGGKDSPDSPGVIGGVARSAEPEKYLRAAFEKTADSIEAAGGDYPDFSRFSNGPSEQSLSLEVIGIAAAPELAGASAGLIAKSDLDSGNILLDLSVGYKGINLKNNQLFFSGDLLAVSMPDLYARHKYISVNPATFADDWNNSPLGEATPIDPAQAAEYMRILDAVNSAAASSRQSAAAERLLSRWKEQAESFYSNAAFKDEGSEELAIAGKSVKKAAKMSYSLPSEKAGAFYASLVSILRDYFDEYMPYMPKNGESGGVNPYSQGDMNDFFDEMEKISFPNGITLICYVNEDTGFVSRILLDDITVSHSDYPGAEFTADTQIDMLGDNSAIDDVAINMTAESNDGQTMVLAATNSAVRGNVVSNAITLSAEANGEKKLGFEYFMSWEPAADKDNFGLNMKITSDGNNIEVNLNGSMTDSDDGVSIQDGVIDVARNGENAASLGFEYAVRSISAQEVDIDRSQATDFFTLDLEQLQQDLMTAAMKFAMLG